MGSDLADLLNPDSHPAHRHVKPALPRLSELASPSPAASISSASPPAHSTSASSSFETSSAAGLQHRPGPQLTPPPTSTLCSPPSLPLPAPTTAWTAVNHLPRIDSSQEPRASANQGRGPGSSQSQGQRRTPPRAIALPRTPLTSQFAPIQHDTPRSSASPIGASYQQPAASPAAKDSTATPSASNWTATSPNFAYFAASPSAPTVLHPAAQPTSPPSPAPSPSFESHHRERATQSPVQDRTSPSPTSPLDTPSPNQGLAPTESTIRGSPGDSGQPYFNIKVVPRRQIASRSATDTRRRARNVRFIDPATNMQMMPPPNPAPRPVDAHGRDSARAGDVAVIQNASDTTSRQDHAQPMTGLAGGSQTLPERLSMPSSASNQPATVSPAAVPSCTCYQDLINDMRPALFPQQSQSEPSSITNMRLADYDRQNEDLVRAIREAAKKGKTLREQCPVCGQPASDTTSIDLVHSRAAPTGESQVSKRKVSSEHPSSGSEASFKSRRLTPDSSSPEPSSHQPITFDHAEAVLSIFTQPRPPVEEGVQVPWNLALAARQQGVDGAASRPASYPKPDTSMFFDTVYEEERKRREASSSTMANSLGSPSNGDTSMEDDS